MTTEESFESALKSDLGELLTMPNQGLTSHEVEAIFSRAHCRKVGRSACALSGVTVAAIVLATAIPAMRHHEPASVAVRPSTVHQQSVEPLSLNKCGSKTMMGESKEPSLPVSITFPSFIDGGASVKAEMTLRNEGPSTLRATGQTVPTLSILDSAGVVVGVLSSFRMSAVVLNLDPGEALTLDATLIAGSCQTTTQPGIYDPYGDARRHPLAAGSYTVIASYRVRNASGPLATLVSQPRQLNVR